MGRKDLVKAYLPESFKTELWTGLYLFFGAVLLYLKELLLI